MSAPIGRWLLIAAGLAIAVTVVAAIGVMGGPGRQREERLDRRRADDLSRIESEVRSYFTAHKSLPTQLTVLAGEPGMALVTEDPVTEKPYEYVAGEAGKFKLCAKFATDTGRDKTGHRDPLQSPSTRWRHPVGRYCYDLEVAKPEQ